MYVTIRFPPRPHYRRTLTHFHRPVGDHHPTPLSFLPCARPAPFPRCFLRPSPARLRTASIVHSPLYQTVSGQWRALSSGAPVAPTSAFSYITRALRQTAPHIVGALRLLAASFSPAELNSNGFALYADFRPEADGWGQRGEVRCSTILSLRKAVTGGDVAGDAGTSSVETPSVSGIVKVETGDEPDARASEPGDQEPPSKKLKQGSPERDEFDAALDDDLFFDEFDLSTIP